MARNVYSVSFYSFQGLNNPGTIITVPAGHVYVVKQLTFYSSPILAPVRGFFKRVGTGATEFAASATTGTPAWEGFYGHLVYEPGEQFRWDVSAALTDGADVSAHGYDLTLP